MSPVAREFFTVDLRGLRAGLTARAADARMTESDVLRSALAAALTASPGEGPCTVAIAPPTFDGPPPTQVKLSIRLGRPAALQLDRNVRAAGLSRGAYLTRLIAGAPPAIASADRAAGFAALSASAEELAVCSRDINQLTQLLRRSSIEAARQYRERLENLDADVRAHLDKATVTLAELSFARGAGRALAAQRRNPP